MFLRTPYTLQIVVALPHHGPLLLMICLTLLNHSRNLQQLETPRQKNGVFAIRPYPYSRNYQALRMESIISVVSDIPRQFSDYSAKRQVYNHFSSFSPPSWCSVAV